MDAPPDLIMTDLVMNGIDGIHLLEAVRSEVRWQDIPFLFVSGRVSEISDLNGLPCLPKPFSLEQLVTTVQSTLMPISI
jgi:CheY-like chemotaxis protein